MMSLQAQEKVWTVDDCIQYAIEHNHDVRLQRMQLNDYKVDKQRAVGAFLPSVEANVGGQFNFGRAIDPETNTYTNVNTFYNNYGMSASVPLFDGFQRINDLRAAKASVLMGRHGLLAQKDRVAQQVLEAFFDVQYYQTALEFVKQKREESTMLLHQTRMMVEVGTKGEADVAQMEATFAADDYEVTRQQGLLSRALLQLKKQMNFPAEEELEIKNEEPQLSTKYNLPRTIKDLKDLKDFLFLRCPLSFVLCTSLHSSSLQSNSHWLRRAKGSSFYILHSSFTPPSIREAEYQLRSAKYAYRSSKGALLPSISVGAGASTTYFKQIGAQSSRNFANQFRNNAGEYVYATLSIPLFNRLNTISNIRRQRNNVERARENLDHARQELHRLIQETVIDQQNSWMEMQKMLEKVEADSIAAQFTIRKYQEGISSSIDVQTATVALLQSKAQLLQCRLNYVYKTRILNYYQGIPLWTESSKRRKD
jgi:outer membrane protein